MISSQSLNWLASLEFETETTKEVVKNDHSDSEGDGIAGDFQLKPAGDAVVPPIKASIEPILILVIALTFFIKKITHSSVNLPSYTQTSFQKLFRTSIFPKAP
ncbi:MAG: hypothetical protein AAF363_01245 [Bacteroidota bacterium]